MSCQCRKSYNGWSNHATWLLNVWGFLDSDYYHQAVHTGSNINQIAEIMENDLREYIDNFYDRDKSYAGLLNDIIESTIDSINFEELAEEVIDNANSELEE